MMLTIARYYSTASRMTNLFRKVTETLTLTLTLTLTRLSSTAPRMTTLFCKVPARARVRLRVSDRLPLTLTPTLAL